MSSQKYYIYKKNKGYYYLAITTYNPKLKKRFFKFISCRTKKKSEALKFLKDYQTKISKEIENHLNSINITFEQFEPIILEYTKNNLSSGTSEIYYYLIQNFKRICGNKQLKLINNNDIEYYKSVRLGEVAKATVNIDLTTLKSLFNIAIRLNFLNINPCQNVRKLILPEKEILSFTNEEVNLILNNTENQDLKNIITLAVKTGMRLNEICHLQIKDIDFKEMIINIKNKENFNVKNKRNRVIPLNSELLELFKKILRFDNSKIIKLKNPEDKVFKYHSDYISHKFKDVLRKLNFPSKYHFHCLRHTFITNMINQGIPISHVQRLAGHQAVKTTENYTHVLLSNLRDAMDKVGK